MSSNLKRLEEYGVRHVEFKFDGSGDSGDIWSAHYSDKEGKDIYAFYKDYPEGFIEAITAVEEGAYASIHETGIDWYNNDGGFGALKYDLIDGKWHSSMEILCRSYLSTLVHEHTNEPIEEEDK